MRMAAEMRSPSSHTQKEPLESGAVGQSGSERGRLSAAAHLTKLVCSLPDAPSVHHSSGRVLAASCDAGSLHLV